MSDETAFSGGCLCGQARYQAAGAPLISLLCHCRMRQRASGAPVTAVQFMPADRLHQLSGRLRTLPFSDGTWREVCDACGGPLFLRRKTRPDIVALYVGSLDEPDRFRPQMHVCVSSALAWLDIRDDTPRYAEKPEGMSPTLQYDPVSGVATRRA